LRAELICVCCSADFVFKDRSLGFSPITEIHAMQDSFDAMKRYDEVAVMMMMMLR
jgi:hypothetical protein